MKKLIQILPVISGILWGSSGTFVRFLETKGLNSLTVVETRLLPAVVMIMIGILVYNRQLLKVRLKDLWIFICGGILGTVCLNYFYNEAINRMTLSVAAVLLCIAPVFVMILSALFFHEKITARKIICMMTAFAGCLMVSGLLEGGASGKWPFSAVAVGLLSAVCYAMYSTFSKAGMGRGYHAVTITVYCFLAAAVFLIPFTDWHAIGKAFEQAPGRMGMFFLIHSFLTSVCPYIFFTLSLNYTDAGMAAILASGEPAAATVFGLILFHEIPSALSVAGIFIVLASLAFLAVSPARNRKVRQTAHEISG